MYCVCQVRTAKKNSNEPNSFISIFHIFVRLLGFRISGHRGQCGVCRVGWWRVGARIIFVAVDECRGFRWAKVGSVSYHKVNERVTHVFGRASGQLVISFPTWSDQLLPVNWSAQQSWLRGTHASSRWVRFGHAGGGLGRFGEPGGVRSRCFVSFIGELFNELFLPSVVLCVHGVFGGEMQKLRRSFREPAWLGGSRPAIIWVIWQLLLSLIAV